MAGRSSGMMGWQGFVELYNKATWLERKKNGKHFIMGLVLVERKRRGAIKPDIFIIPGMGWAFFDFMSVLGSRGV